jgi:DNA polymerase-4
MRSEGYSGNVISVYVRFADFTSFNSRKTLPFWFNDEQTIFRFAWELASKSILLQQVRLLGVSVSGVHKRYQMHLFGNERLEFALRTMDTINNEYGTDTVFPAMMLYERQKYMPVAKTHAFQFSALKKFSSGRS